MVHISCPPELGPEFPDRLRKWKEQHHLTLDEMADLTTISRRQIARWLKSQPDPAGSAAERWKSLCSGALPGILRKEARALLEQADQLEKNFSSPLTD